MQDAEALGLQQGQQRALRREHVFAHRHSEKEFGFKRLVVSNWANTDSTAQPVNAGMNLDMPGGPRIVAMTRTTLLQEDSSECGHVYCGGW